MNRHPQLHPPYVKRLFSYLPLKDLVTARKVCKTWNELATPFVNARLDEISIGFWSFSEQENIRDIKKFLDMKRNSRLDFSSFILGGSAPLDCGSVRQELLDSFPETLTKLQLFYDEDAKYGLTREVFKDLLITKAPLMESLMLTLLPAKLKKSRIFNASDSIELELTSLAIFLEDRTEEYSEAFLKDIFKASRKLTELQVDSNYRAWEDVEEVLCFFIKYGRPAQLKKLDFSHINDGTMRKLCNCVDLRSSPLEFFKADKVNVSKSARISRFLATHKDSLKDLHLSFDEFEADDYETTPPVQLPIMNNLKSLTLGLYNKTFVDVDYGKLFPKLEVLKTKDNHQYRNRFPRSKVDLGIFPMSSSPCPSVTELELPENLDDAQVLRNIARIFPNVVKLNLSAQRVEVLEALWECWPKMERLAISLIMNYPRKVQYTTRSVGSIFTGFAEATIVELNKKLEKGEVLNMAELEKDREKPSICNLNHLKYLIIHGGPNLKTKPASAMDTRHLLTDVTLTTSLASLKNLLCLMIEQNTHTFSVSAVEKLAQSLELEAVMDSNGNSSKNAKLHEHCHLIKYDWQEVNEDTELEYYWQKII